MDPLPPSAPTLTLYVIDQIHGMVVQPNILQNDFSTYNVELDANVISSTTTVPTYSWNMSSAPDATNVSGTSSYRLQFTWASFTGAARSDSVTITVTSGTTQVSQTISFLVTSTSSPAYSATQPTNASTWPSLLPPDALTDRQALGGQGPYYSVGLNDGELITTHTLPAYNPNVPPLKLIYVSTTADAEPIFVAIIN
jgi:hypothetical protein